MGEGGREGKRERKRGGGGSSIVFGKGQSS